MKKRKNLIIGVLILIIVLLVTLLFLITTGKIDYSNKENCNIDYDELAKIATGDYNFMSKESYSNNSAIVLSNGKVLVNFDYYIENIINAKDLVLFSVPSDDTILYILTINGDIYKYNLDDANSKNFNASKIDEHKNIKQILRYETRKGNAGGCDYVILIDNNGKYYSLDSYCV